MRVSLVNVVTKNEVFTYVIAYEEVDSSEKRHVMFQI